MQNVIVPQTPEELAEALAEAAAARRRIALAGNGSKRLMGGPAAEAEVSLSTTGLNRVLEYDPRDLTISVGAGLPWCQLAQVLAEKGQMIPLDPPFEAGATVGGVIATNGSGPRRLLYGTARDMVIGMRFATLEGKLVQSGGMVVKNVAGLDMAKLLIGSFGTLAAIAVVNFKVQPRPSQERTFVLAFDSAAEAFDARQKILGSALQPEAMDLLTPAAAGQVGRSGYLLAVQAGGNPAAMARYQRELAGLGAGAALEGEPQAALWRGIQNFTARYLTSNPDGAVVRVSCTLKEMPAVMRSLDAPAVARAGSGVLYACFTDSGRAAAWAGEAARQGARALVECAPEARKAALELWPAPGSDFALMQRIKQMFDPDGLLNRGRLYRRI